MDFVMKHLDFALYATMGNTFAPKPVPLCDRILPIFELTYHGTLLYNPIATTVNYTAQSPLDRLIFIMRGGRPAMYFYSRFRTGQAKNWMGDGDLTCDTDEALARSVALIKQAADEQALLADRQLLCMTDYEILESGLHVATYEDGKRMVGNFSEVPTTYEGVTLAPYGYAML